MTTLNFLEKLGHNLPWIREHQRIRRASRRAFAESEAFRRDVALKLMALRLEIRRRGNGETAQ